MKVKTIACFNRFNKLIINRSIYGGNKVSNKVIARMAVRTW